MVRQPEHEGSESQVIRHRVRAVAQGLRRVDVTVPGNDAGLVKAVAAALRAGGDEASRVREALAFTAAFEPVRTGAELLDFLRASPLVGEDLTIERGQTTGRVADLPWHDGTD